MMATRHLQWSLPEILYKIQVQEVHELQYYLVALDTQVDHAYLEDPGTQVDQAALDIP